MHSLTEERAFRQGFRQNKEGRVLSDQVRWWWPESLAVLERHDATSSKEKQRLALRRLILRPWAAFLGSRDAARAVAGEGFCFVSELHKVSGRTKG